MSIRATIFLSCLAFGSFSQNLVSNSSFEEFFRCPGSYNYAVDGKLAPSWFSPTTGTPDLFNVCSKGDAGVPTNWAGNSKALSGVAYGGIYVFLKSRKNYREYLQNELTQPLVGGGKYYVEFYFKLSSNSKYSIDRIGFLLSDSAQWQKHDVVFNAKPTYELVMASAYMRSTGTWIKCSYALEARGGEKYLTIGNFSSNEKTRDSKIHFSKAKETMLDQAAYFFIDDVRVVRTDEPRPQKPTTLTGYPDVKLNVSYILRNIMFEFDRYQLVDSSFNELSKLVSILKEKPTWNVTLTGHTDERGTNEYNQKLSEDRTKSIRDYLFTKGIDSNRIIAQGEGKRRPLVLGTDEASHAINRRVELKFLK